MAPPSTHNGLEAVFVAAPLKKVDTRRPTPSRPRNSTLRPVRLRRLARWVPGRFQICSMA